MDNTLYLNQVYLGNGQFEPFDIEVRYTVQPASSTQHELDDPTTTEYFPEEIYISAITSTSDISVVNDDGEVDEVLPIGTDVLNLRQIKNVDIKWVADQVEKARKHKQIGEAKSAKKIVAYFSPYGYQPEFIESFTDKEAAKKKYQKLKRELRGSDQFEFQEAADDGSILVGFHDHRQEGQDVWYIGTYKSRAEAEIGAKKWLENIDFGDLSDIDYIDA